MDIIVRRENEKDFGKIGEVIKSAFYREGMDETFNEWNLVESIRNSEFYIKDLSLVAEVKGEIIGHIMFSPMKIVNEETSFDSLALAPLAVHKNFQGIGGGKVLVKAGIETVKRLGYESIIVMGSPGYYKKFGFEESSKYNIGTSYDFNDEHLLAMELFKGSLSGVKGIIRYCRLFYNELGELI